MRAFVAVTLPLARPSLVAGVSLAMMEALADFGTVAASRPGATDRPPQAESPASGEVLCCLP